MRSEARTRRAVGVSEPAAGPGREGWTAVTRQALPALLSRTSYVRPPGTTRSPPRRRQDLVTTSTLAVSASRPPYWASITWSAVSGPLPVPSTRRTADSLQAGTSSPGPGRQGVTSGSAAGVSAGLDGPDGEVCGASLADSEETVGDGDASSDSWVEHPAASSPAPPSSSPRRDGPIRPA